MKNFEVASYRKNYQVEFSENVSATLNNELKEGDWVFIDKMLEKYIQIFRSDHF